MTLHVSEMREQGIRGRVYDAMIRNDYIDSRDVDKSYLDSLDGVGLVMAIEDEFDIDISNEDTDRIIGPMMDILNTGNRPSVLVDAIVRYVADRKDVE
ncbi:MAG: hypothetical protein KKF50_03170 [Nanoarchaeota archaeon]|nr:hypothetical protein [Nanoarchaeota archaeon]